MFGKGDHNVANAIKTLFEQKNALNFDVNQVKHTCYCGKDAETAQPIEAFEDSGSVFDVIG